MTTRLTPTILRFDSLPSTNTEAARQAALGAREGLCVVAREQTAGRGRRERSWISPKDAGLYFSIVLRPKTEAREWPLITLAAAVAVADALREACALETDIKWPNDIHARGRKLCGILAETVEGCARRAVVLGIGINLTNGAFPPEILETATSVEEETGRAPVYERLLAALTRNLSRAYEELTDGGGAPAIIAQWESRSTYARARSVRVALAGEIFEGVTRGLEPDGALRVETPDGRTRTVRAGDVEALRNVMSDE
jgi:BirA family transcriptional regulator, biotin operon repressor / biotin---[acetyl-CoA-carboxylase] ligase